MTTRPRRRWALPAVVLALGACAACGGRAAECPAGVTASGQQVVLGSGETAGAGVVFESVPWPPPVSRHFTVRGMACGGARLLRVDADMPAHRHGMNYRPTIQPLGDGRFEVVGLMFHMPGVWRLRFEIEYQGRPAWLTQTVHVK